ncbi:hypothetical protein DFJ73DRAFT_774065 [Zopfochytrium polystomum]|nr:hypothetical protein DFJ73DRAFT_774065 [Zopfochytrium polystomum]
MGSPTATRPASTPHHQHHHRSHVLLLPILLLLFHLLILLPNKHILATPIPRRDTDFRRRDPISIARRSSGSTVVTIASPLFVSTPPENHLTSHLVRRARVKIDKETGQPNEPVQTAGDRFETGKLGNSRFNAAKAGLKETAYMAQLDGTDAAVAFGASTAGAAIRAVAGKTAGKAAAIAIGATASACIDCVKAVVQKKSAKDIAKQTLAGAMQGTALQLDSSNYAKVPLVSAAWDLRQGKSLMTAANTAANAADADWIKQAAANPLEKVQKAKMEDAKKNGNAPAEEPKSKMQKAGSVAKTIGKLGVKTGYAIANKAVPVAVAGAVTAAAGPIAGCAAGLCTAAAMGAAHGVVSSALKGESPKKMLKNGVAVATHQVASWVPGGRAIHYGVHAAGNSLADGKGMAAAVQNGVAGYAGMAASGAVKRIGATPMTGAMVMDTVQSAINGVANTIKGDPNLSKNGKKLQAAGKYAGKTGNVIKTIQGKIVAKKIDGGRADAGAKKNLAVAQGSAKGNLAVASGAAKKDLAAGQGAASRIAAPAKGAAAKNGAAAAAAADAGYKRVQQGVKGAGPTPSGPQFKTPDSLKPGAKTNLQFKTPDSLKPGAKTSLQFKTPDSLKPGAKTNLKSSAPDASKKGVGGVAQPPAAAAKKTLGRSPPATKENAGSVAARATLKAAGNKAVAVGRLKGAGADAKSPKAAGAAGGETAATTAKKGLSRSSSAPAKPGGTTGKAPGATKELSRSASVPKAASPAKAAAPAKVAAPAKAATTAMRGKK